MKQQQRDVLLKISQKWLIWRKKPSKCDERGVLYLKTCVALIHYTKLTSSSALHNCSSAYSLNGSKLYRIVPEKRTGSWGIIDTEDRSFARGMLAVLTSSRRTVPSGSVRRKIVAIRDDLPAPVRPTMPTCNTSSPQRQQSLPTRNPHFASLTFSAGLMQKLRSRRTGLSSAEYLK